MRVMYLDLIVFAIVVLTMVQGYRHGFVKTVMHMIGWVLSLVAAFVCYPYVLTYIKEKTDFYDAVYQAIETRLAATTNATSEALMVDGIPDIVKRTFQSATDTVVSSTANHIAGILFSIISFLLIMIVIKFALYFIVGLFSKERHGGIISGVDGTLGLITGGIKGMFLVFILLALLVPISHLIGTSFLLDELDNSLLARELYDNNIVLLAITDFF